MATVNSTNVLDFHKKRGICNFVAEIDFADENNILNVSGDVYQIGVLPANISVKSAVVITVKAADSTTLTCDVSLGATLLADDVNLKAADGTIVEGTVAVYKPLESIVTFTPTLTGTLTSGKVTVVIEYVELGKVTGELTRFLPA